jgi:phospholipid transport system substrate-binding protein
MTALLTPLVFRFAALVVVVLLVQPAHATQPDAARQFIAELGDRTIEILEDDSLGLDQRIGEFRELFREGFDVATIGRFVLGRYWRQASEEQQEAYLDLFEDWIVQTYARRFSDYSGETFEIVDVRPEGDDVQVTTRIVRGDAPAVDVAWRVRERNGTMNIIDVKVEQVSMLATQRDEFAALIQRNGGNVQALIDALRDRVEVARNGG